MALEPTVGMEKEKTKLTCRVAGYPPPEVQWLHNDKELVAGDNHNIKFDGTECTLSIIKTRKKDAGKYTCRVSCPFPFNKGACSISCCLCRAVVLRMHTHEMVGCRLPTNWAPRNAVQKWSLPGNQSLNLCWKRRQSVVREQRSFPLLLRPPFSNLSLKPNFVRSVWEIDLTCLLITGILLTLSEGENAEFSCKYKGEPRPTVTWFLNNEQITDFSKYSISEKDGVATLSLTGTTKNMAGKYTVRVQNPHGKDECSAELVVKTKGARHTHIFTIL